MKIKKLPFEVQVGGDHYTRMKIQPLDFIMENNIPFAEANVIKYVCRHANKNGIQDLEKARHYLDIAIHHYYEKDSK